MDRTIDEAQAMLTWRSIHKFDIRKFTFAAQKTMKKRRTH